MRPVTSLASAACGALLLATAGVFDGAAVGAVGLALFAAGIGGVVLPLVWSPAEQRASEGRP